MFEVTLKGHNPQTVLAADKKSAYQVALAAIRTLLDKPTHSPLSERIVAIQPQVGDTAAFVADLA